jgi:membrane-associated phospholipid phosphatase
VPGLRRHVRADPADERIVGPVRLPAGPRRYRQAAVHRGGGGRGLCVRLARVRPAGIRCGRLLRRRLRVRRLTGSSRYPADPSRDLLLPGRLRGAAAALLIGCAAVTAALGAVLAGHHRPSRLDAAVDGWLARSLSHDHAQLADLSRLGQPAQVTVLAVVLLLACAAARRWRGCVLTAVAVPAAAVLAELVLKPLVGRRATWGALTYPSVHAASDFAIAAAFALLLVTAKRLRPVVRAVVAAAAFGVAGAVALAMVSLGYHYFTDAVGGACVGVAVVLLTALAADAGAALLPHAPGRACSM